MSLQQIDTNDPASRRGAMLPLPNTLTQGCYIGSPESISFPPIRL